jgi:hypothetical protein
MKRPYSKKKLEQAMQSIDLNIRHEMAIVENIKLNVSIRLAEAKTKPSPTSVSSHSLFSPHKPMPALKLIKNDPMVSQTLRSPLKQTQSLKINPCASPVKNLHELFPKGSPNKKKLCSAYSPMGPS